MRPILRVAVTSSAVMSVALGIGCDARSRPAIQQQTLLELRIAVTPGDAPQSAALVAELAEGGPAALEQKKAGMVWRMIDEPAWFALTSDEQRQVAEDPTAFFRDRNLIAASHADQHYLLLYDTPDSAMTRAQSDWNLINVYETVDDRGFPAIQFTMNDPGARKLRAMTEQHIGEPLAILVADRVYTAPIIVAAIGRDALISVASGFTAQELKRLIPLLRGERPVDGAGAAAGDPPG